MFFISLVWSFFSISLVDLSESLVFHPHRSAINLQCFTSVSGLRRAPRDSCGEESYFFVVVNHCQTLVTSDGVTWWVIDSKGKELIDTCQIVCWWRHWLPHFVENALNFRFVISKYILSSISSKNHCSFVRMNIKSVSLYISQFLC